MFFFSNTGCLWITAQVINVQHRRGHVRPWSDGGSLGKSMENDPKRWGFHETNWPLPALPSKWQFPIAMLNYHIEYPLIYPLIYIYIYTHWSIMVVLYPWIYPLIMGNHPPMAWIPSSKLTWRPLQSSGLVQTSETTINWSFSGSTS